MIKTIKIFSVAILSILSFSSVLNAEEKDNKWEYKQYSGKINNKYPINMTLVANKDPNVIKGYYSYNESRKILTLSGQEVNGVVSLDEFENGEKVTGSFRGSFVGDSFKGDWSNPNSDNKMPFYVTRNYNNKTLIKDSKIKKSLLGSNNCSLQWISWAKLGTLKVEEKDNKLIVNGSQKMNGDELIIDGFFTAVNTNRLDFNGKITTKISHINSGQPCYREGDMTFMKYSGRNFWRLQEMNNPCDGVTDYVDISIRK